MSKFTRRGFLLLLGSSTAAAWVAGHGIVRTLPAFLVNVEGQCAFCFRAHEEASGLLGVIGSDILICRHCMSAAELVARPEPTERNTALMVDPQVFDRATGMLGGIAYERRARELPLAAIAELEALARQTPMDERAYLKLADLYTKTGQFAAGLGAYRLVALRYQATGFWLKSVAVIRQILKIDALRPGQHERLYELYESLGLSTDAANHAKRVHPAHGCSFCAADAEEYAYGFKSAWLCDECRVEGAKVFQQTTLFA